MALVWFFLGSILGVAAMVAMNAFLKISKKSQILSLDDASQLLDIDSIGFESGSGVLSSDHRAALVEETGSERIALLAARGDGVVIRYLVPGLVKAARMDGDDLGIKLNDFTFAPVTMKFDTHQTARAWADKLNKLQA